VDCSWQSEVINNEIWQFCQSWVINNFALFWCLTFVTGIFHVFDRIHFYFKRYQYLLPKLILLHSYLCCLTTIITAPKRIIQGLTNRASYVGLTSKKIFQCMLKIFSGHDKLEQRNIRIISCLIHFNFSYEWMKPFNCAEFSTIIDINYGIGSLASCVSIENKHAPILVYVSSFFSDMGDICGIKFENNWLLYKTLGG